MALVGFYPRLHTLGRTAVGNVPAAYEYHSWWYVWWTGRYSIVLTKAAVFHKGYLRLYHGPSMPSAVRQYVDDHMNCEVRRAPGGTARPSGAALSG